MNVSSYKIFPHPKIQNKTQQTNKPKSETKQNQPTNQPAKWTAATTTNTTPIVTTTKTPGISEEVVGKDLQCQRMRKLAVKKNILRRA